MSDWTLVDYADLVTPERCWTCEKPWTHRAFGFQFCDEHFAEFMGVKT